MQEIAEAIDLATSAIELKPDTYEGYFARAKAYLENGSITEALKDSKMSIEKAVNTSSDTKKILIRFQDDLSQRPPSINTKNIYVNESIDTTDL